MLTAVRLWTDKMGLCLIGRLHGGVLGRSMKRAPIGISMSRSRFFLSGLFLITSAQRGAAVGADKTKRKAFTPLASFQRDYTMCTSEHSFSMESIARTRVWQWTGTQLLARD